MAIPRFDLIRRKPRFKDGMDSEKRMVVLFVPNLGLLNKRDPSFLWAVNQSPLAIPKV